jgi:hypothetical protein
MLHPGDWVFFRLRPSGFPTARLATMCFLLPALFDGGALRQIVALFQREGLSAGERERRLRALFVIEPDSFWSTHLHFGAEGDSHGIALGRTRVTEFIVNCIIPVAVLYGRIFETTSISLRAFQVYENLAGATVYRTTRRQWQEIMARRAPLSRAAMQQGILQLEKNYCARRRCVECRIGAAIRIQSVEKSA